MTPADYDAWYDTPRGRWIGDTELHLLTRLLDPRAGEKLLDVGCGTGWFTRRLAAIPGLLSVTGLDPNAEWLRYAREHDARSAYLDGDARALPFADSSFDRVIAITSLCFIADWRLALSEMVRVTRARFAIAVLNRASLLWRDKGQDGGTGAYRNAHWHTAAELRAAFAELPVDDLRFHSAIFLPSGSCAARIAETILPSGLPFGGLLVATGAKD